MEWERGQFRIACGSSLVDLKTVAEFLADSYWAKGIPPTTVERSIENSLCFVLLHNNRQIGFARVITDYATIAYLNDVFVLPNYREQGLGKWLIECVMSHAKLQGLKRWILATRDAHDLYRRYGFTQLKRPEIFMELHDPDVYVSGKGGG